MPNWSDDEGRCHCEFCAWQRDPHPLSRPHRKACIKAPREVPQEVHSTSPRSPDEQRAYIEGIEFSIYVLRAQPPNLFNRTRLLAALELEVRKAKR